MPEKKATARDLAADDAALDAAIGEQKAAEVPDKAQTRAAKKKASASKAAKPSDIAAENAEDRKTILPAGSKKAPGTLQYKGHPLVRCGDELYYGSLDKPFACRLVIKSKHTFQDLEVADKVTISLMNTDPDLPANEAFINTSSRPGLYAAVDLASTWLDRQLRKA
ncbi:MAG: hypothetical protein LBR73_07475 [Oscillospiraceae bacterium]|nr:hypothetical protein [Oscillospiraceae bacterium]